MYPYIEIEQKQAVPIQIESILHPQAASDLQAGPQSDLQGGPQSAAQINSLTHNMSNIGGGFTFPSPLNSTNGGNVTTTPVFSWTLSQPTMGTTVLQFPSPIYQTPVPSQASGNHEYPQHPLVRQNGQNSSMLNGQSGRSLTSAPRSSYTFYHNMAHVRHSIATQMNHAAGITIPGYTRSATNSWVPSSLPLLQPYTLSSSTRVCAAVCDESGGHMRFSATPMTVGSADTRVRLSHRESSPQPGTSGMSKRKNKRKADTVYSDIGGKVFINEDKMSESMKELSLSGGKTWRSVQHSGSQWIHTKSPNQARMTLEEIDNRLSSTEEEDEILEYDLKDNNNDSYGGPRLQLSETLELGLKNKDLLPNMFLDQLSKPCMEVVLWKAPGDFVKEVVRDVTDPDLKNRHMCDKTMDRVSVDHPRDTRHSVVREVHQGVTVEDLFDSMDDDDGIMDL